MVERKYYAPGIGVFLETAPQTGEVVRLVKCNVDPRCALLPHKDSQALLVGQAA